MEQLTPRAPAGTAISHDVEAAGRTESARIEGSLIVRAKAGDQSAVISIFRQFLPSEERIDFAEHLGFQGWIFGQHSLGCLTEKRIARVTLGFSGEVIYQDAFLEHCTSSVVFQPSKLALYVYVAVAVCGGLVGANRFGTGVGDYFRSPASGFVAALLFAAPAIALLLNLVVRFYYAIRKCGLVVSVNGGVSVYLFADRKRLTRARVMLRQLSAVRDRRIGDLGYIGRAA